MDYHDIKFSNIYMTRETTLTQLVLVHAFHLQKEFLLQTNCYYPQFWHFQKQGYVGIKKE